MYFLFVFVLVFLIFAFFFFWLVLFYHFFMLFYVVVKVFGVMTIIRAKNKIGEPYLSFGWVRLYSLHANIILKKAWTLFLSQELVKFPHRLSCLILEMSSQS